MPVLLRTHKYKCKKISSNLNIHMIDKEFSEI